MTLLNGLLNGNGNGNANGNVVNATKLIGNDASAGWVVQKFGGTSVGKFAVEIAEGIVR